MCHQSVGLIARHIEAAGIPTIGFSSARSITASANPPRTVLLDAPLGHTTGAPNDPQGQRSLLAEGLTAGYAIDEPGTIVALPYRWEDDDWKASPLSWSRRAQSAGTSGADGGDTRAGRSKEPVYQSVEDEALADARSTDEHCLTCLGLAE